MKKMDDFGAKIGGARKDLWKSRGLSWNDTLDMTDNEKLKYVNRDNIWKKQPCEPDADKDTRLLSFFKNHIRLCVYPKPINAVQLSDRGLQHYVDAVQKLKQIIDRVNSVSEIPDFYDWALDGGVIQWYHGGTSFSATAEFEHVVDIRKIIEYRGEHGVDRMRRDMEKQNYGLSKESILRKQYIVKEYRSDKLPIHEDSWNGTYLEVPVGFGSEFYYDRISKSNRLKSLKDGDYLLLCAKDHQILLISSEETCREMEESLIKTQLKQTKPKKKASKEHWIPPQLQNIERTGEDYLHGRHVTGPMFMNTFHIRGVEFGNWETSMDRQISLDKAFESFKDIARILKIEETDIGLPELSTGGLGIGFGSRGIPYAAGHYEPLTEAMSIPKMHGAGSLVHEFGHAIDDAIGKHFGVRGNLASECLVQIKDDFVHVYKALIDSMILSPDKDKVYTKYYEESLAFDKVCSKTEQGYWHSNCEMFARAFACYILDKGKQIGIKNDYMTGHAESSVYPKGEERERINKQFDTFFEELKKIGIFHHHDYAKDAEEKKKQQMEVGVAMPFAFLEADSDGQLSFA